MFTLCVSFMIHPNSALVACRWGDQATKHSPKATIEFLHAVVQFLGDEYGADLQRVTLAGFSRGAIGAWFVGLFNDAVAALWHSFVVYAHCDGEYPLGVDFDDADTDANITARLQRLQGRPSFVCNCDVKAEAADIGRLCPASPHACAGVQYSNTPFRNHNDQWILRPSAERSALWSWYNRSVVHGDRAPPHPHIQTHTPTATPAHTHIQTHTPTPAAASPPLPALVVTVEHAHTALAVTSLTPRFSWAIPTVGSRPGEVQTSYSVTVRKASTSTTPRGTSGSSTRNTRNGFSGPPGNRTANKTLSECPELQCAGHNPTQCSQLPQCQWDERLGCFPAPHSCCLAMGSETCTSPDPTRWPCCCPGYGVLPSGCSHPCSLDSCGCTGRCTGAPPHAACCRAAEPCLPGAQVGAALPVCCPGHGASGAMLCLNYKCLDTGSGTAARKADTPGYSTDTPGYSTRGLIHSNQSALVRLSGLELDPGSFYVADITVNTNQRKGLSQTIRFGTAPTQQQVSGQAMCQHVCRCMVHLRTRTYECGQQAGVTWRVHRGVRS